MKPLNRRTLLAGIAASGAVGVSGCLGDATTGSTDDEDDHGGSTDGCVDDDLIDHGLDGHVCPSGDPPAVPPALECTEEEVADAAPEHGPFDPTRYETIYRGEEINWGDGAIFALRVSETSYELGETVELTLQNYTDEDEEFNDYRSFNFEIYTEAGWEDVRMNTYEGELPWVDDGDAFEAGDSWEYAIELTEQGIVDESYGEHVAVCPDLQKGRYRFVFANQFGERENVAVAFDVADT